MMIVVATFGLAIASALIPLINIEAYLGTVALTMDDIDLWWLCIAAGVGQMVGKVIWYEAGRRSMKWAWIRKKMSTPKRARQYELWKARVHGRPVVTGLVLFASAFVGLPPFAVISVLAGQLRMSFPLFLATGLVGRTGRFALILGGVSLVPLG